MAMFVFAVLLGTEPAHAQGVRAVEDLSIGTADGSIEYTLAQVADGERARLRHGS